MRTISSQWNAKITDGVTKQECLLINGKNTSYPTGMLSAIDGDFTSDGVTIEQTGCDTDDLRFGNVGSAQISFSLINERGWMLADFPWDMMTCYIGPLMSEKSVLRDFGATAYIETNNATYYAYGNELYKFEQSEELIYTGSAETVFTGLLNYGGYLIALGEGECICYNYSTGTISAVNPNRMLAHKLMKGVSYSFDLTGNTGGAAAYVDYTRCIGVQGPDLTEYRMETYRLANCGRFDIRKPDNLQDDVVEINDAHDVLGNLDIDATDLISSITYPTTMKAIAEAAIDLIGDNITIVNPNITQYTASITKSPFGSGSYTVRDILKMIAEALARNIIADGGADAYTDTLRLKFVKAAKDEPALNDETLDWSRIASGTLKIKSYDTDGIKEIVLKKANGSTDVISVSDFASHYSSIYEISNNPFVKSIAPGTPIYTELYSTSLDPNKWVYTPTSLSVIYANPLVELGDKIVVRRAAEASVPKYDVYGRDTGQTELTGFVSFPLMHRTLHWQGFCFADYEATGNAVRYAEKSAQTYQNNVAMDYADSLEVQLNTKINNISDNLGKRENVDDTTGIDVSSEVTTNINSLVLETGHKYIILAHVDFPSNATGRRGIFVSNTSGSDSPLTNGSRVIQNAVNGAATRMQCVFIANLTSTSVLYLNVFQNSGSVLKCASYMDAIRII